VPVLKSEKQELFAQELSKGLSIVQAARNAGFTEKSAQTTGSHLAKDSAVIARVAELKSKVAEYQSKAAKVALEQALEQMPTREAAFVLQAVRERQYRLSVIQDLVDRLRMVIDERAAAGRKDHQGVPGAGTGLLVRTLKSLREGKKIKIHEFWELDGVTIQKLYDGLKQAAIEAGEWQEEARSQPLQGPDLSHLTPEQLFAEQRILREAMEQIEAVRSGERPPVMLEAAAEIVDAQEEAADQPGVSSVPDADLAGPDGLIDRD
jgi:hypothetical protein